MVDILAKIEAYKREEIAAAKASVGINELTARIAEIENRAAFSKPSGPNMPLVNLL
jgi:indole-3-glycerol phosphate synthase